MNRKRKISRWELLRVTRRRLIPPFTYEFVWNMQTEAWFESVVVPIIKDPEYEAKWLRWLEGRKGSTTS